MTTVTQNFVELNQPSSNIFQPTESILPDRYNSISLPIGFSIVGRELSTISEPCEAKEGLAKKKATDGELLGDD